MAAAELLGTFTRALRSKSATSGLTRGLTLGRSGNTFRTSSGGYKPFQGSRRRATVRAASDTNNQPALPARDPFKAASLRLQNLLSGVGDGEDEMVDDILGSEPANVKVLLAIVSGAFVSTGALIICWLTHSDLWGGASFSPESVQAGLLGGALALPVVLLKAFIWSSPAHQIFPVLEDVYKAETQRMRPLVVNMSLTQVVAVVFAEVLSSLLLLLPAAQGGLTASFQFYFNYLQEAGYGMHVPKEVAPMLSVVGIALLCGLGRMVDHAPTEEEFKVVGNAVSNADRYYKLVNTTMTQRQDEADRMSAAFKLTAAAWYTRRTVAGSVSAVIAFCELLFLGILWRSTNDLAAPVVAALLLYGTDFLSIPQGPHGDQRAEP